MLSPHPLTLNLPPSPRGRGLKFKIPIFYFLFSTFYFLIATHSFASTVELSRLEMKRDRGYDYLDIYTTGYSESKGLLLEDKLILDFPGARIAEKLRILKRKSKRIADIRTEQKKDTARIIVSLKHSVDYDVVNVFGQNKSVVELGNRENDIFSDQFNWEASNVKKPAPPLKPVKLAAIVSAKDVSLKGETIMLDPGHGGDDPGANFPGKLPEKTLTLLTAQAAAKVLRAAGATVYLTRDEDRRSNLRDIAEFANKSKADIFISIHYNSTDGGRIGGSETYYYNPLSRGFAEKMHEAIVRGLQKRDRGLHRVQFYTVNHTTMPSVLIEPVYISNDDEYNLASSDAFREKLAQSITKGVKEYFRDRQH